MVGLGFAPFTFGKDNKTGNQQNAGGADKPQFVPTDGFKPVYQKTATHNLGKRGKREHALTCSAYTNAISSSVAMFISSREHAVH